MSGKLLGRDYGPWNPEKQIMLDLPCEVKTYHTTLPAKTASILDQMEVCRQITCQMKEICRVRNVLWVDPKETCSPMIGYFFDTMIIASSDKDWL